MTKARAPYGPVCDTSVERAAMVHWWDELTFLHWRFEPDGGAAPAARRAHGGDHGRHRVGRARPVLPPRRAARRAVGPVAVPVRRDERAHLRPQRGRRARHLVLLPRRRAPRRGASPPGRPTASRTSGRGMSIERVGNDDLATGAVGAGPGLAGRAATSSSRSASRSAPTSCTELDHFLTARWALFSAPRSGLHHALAVHEPWPLHRPGRSTCTTSWSRPRSPQPERRAPRPLLAVRRGAHRLAVEGRSRVTTATLPAPQ